MTSARVLAIVGSTASGKTPLSLFLAQQLNGKIISADSRQIYRHLDIGTAKPSKEELKRVPHHFIDILEPTEEYSAGQFGKEAREVINSILRKNKLPIVIGGSGLYLRALIDGLFEGPGKDPELRNQLEERLSREGGVGVLDDLMKVDPASAAKMDPTKPRRIIRALEVYYATGIPLSQFHAVRPKNSPFEFIQVGIEWNRAELYRRINERVDAMMMNGFLDEVKSLPQKGFSRSLNALNTVGYKEMFDYLEGKTSREQAVELMKRNTRRLAKRQLTWFRGDKRIKWVPCDSGASIEMMAKDVVSMWRK